MINPEAKSNESKDISEENPYEILKKGREEMKNSPHVKEMRERRRFLGHEQKMLEKEYNFNTEGIRIGTIKNLDIEHQEMVRQKVKEISEKLEKNEAEQAKLRKDIEEIEDVVKVEMLDASKELKEKN